MRSMGVRIVAVSAVAVAVLVFAAQGGARAADEPPVWTRVIDRGHYELSTSLAPTGDGAVVLAEEYSTCSDPVSDCRSVALTVLEADGRTRWSRALHPGLFEGGSATGAIVVGVASRSLVVASLTERDPTWRRAGQVIAAYDRGAGTLHWRTTIRRPGTMVSVRDLVAGPNGGRVFLASVRRADRGSWYRPVVEARATVSGALLWSYTAPRAPGISDDAVELATSPDGRLVVAAFENPSAGVTVVGLDAVTGGRRWRATIPVGDNLKVWDVAADPNGRRFAVAISDGRPWDDPGYGPYDDAMLVAAVRSGGSIGWTRRFTGPVGLTTQPSALTATRDRVYVTGWTGVAPEGCIPDDYDECVPTDTQMLTLALRGTDGAVIWERMFGGGRVDAAAAIDTAGGTVLVTGWLAAEPPANDGTLLAVVAYGAHTGAVRWSDRFRLSQQPRSSPYYGQDPCPGGGHGGRAVVTLPARELGVVVGCSHRHRGGQEVAVLAYGL